MSDIDRRRENLQDIATIERLRAEREPECSALAGSLLIAMALRDKREIDGGDTTELSESLRRLRARSAKALYERITRLIAVPRTVRANTNAAVATR